MRSDAALDDAADAAGLPLPGSPPSVSALRLPSPAWRAARDTLDRALASAISPQALGDACQQLLAVHGEAVTEFIRPEDARASRANPKRIPEESFLIRPSAACTALYEGRMVHHFDHAQKGWLHDEGPRAIWESIPIHDKALRPRVFVAPPQVGAPRPCRIAFGAVASAVNERSLLAALISDGCLAGNSTPTLALPTRTDAALLLYVMSSFVFDYLVRLRTTTNISWTQLSRIAVPRPEDIPPSDRRTLAQAAAHLSRTTPERPPSEPRPSPRRRERTPRPSAIRASAPCCARTSTPSSQTPTVFASKTTPES